MSAGEPEAVLILTNRPLRKYHAVVRRALSIALLGLFGISLIPPSVFASDDDSGLPACCRRNGRHRCTLVNTMAAGEGSSSGAALQSSRCRVFPDATRVPVSPRAGVFETPLAPATYLPISLAEHQATETPSPVLFHSPHQQRGPPELLLA